MFLRMLLWLVLLFAAWWFFRPRRKAPPSASAAAGMARGRQGADVEAEAMVDCAHCGVHLPSSEALRDDAARTYCSNEHRIAGPRSER
jgi:uncharacterized protein